jgi:hypothetical protein
MEALNLVCQIVRFKAATKISIEPAFEVFMESSGFYH